jgi:putative membrane protein insertion efficiency factor
MRPRDLLIGALRFYQLAISPHIGNCCRFHPSCSEYMIGSVRLNGAFVGALDGAWRILRCHPFHPGGVDEPKRIHIFGKRDRWDKKNG